MFPGGCGLHVDYLCTRDGKPLLWELFDVRIPYMEELTTCHVVLVNNVSSCSEMLWFLSGTQWTSGNVFNCINNLTRRQLWHERHEREIVFFLFFFYYLRCGLKLYLKLLCKHTHTHSHAHAHKHCTSDWFCWKRKILDSLIPDALSLSLFPVVTIVKLGCQR